MNSHDLRLRNKSTHARGLVIFIEEERIHARCIQPNLRAKMAYKYCSVLCSHS